jgi:2'-5' RNA ligase
MFFALWPDAVTRARIAPAAAALTLGPGARAVPPENYHLTVAFVGEIPIADIEVLRQIGRQQRAERCVIHFDAYEYWPKPAVVVAAARSIPPQLQDFWRVLHRDLAAAGMAQAPKRLRPHVTLARKAAQAIVPEAMSSFAWEARDFCLVHSVTGGVQSAYTVVDTWPLLDETSPAL